MKLYGLMITKDDEAIFEEWCADQLGLYDAVVCLDGSEGGATERIAQRYPDRLVYLHERDYFIPHKTDHGLRAIVHGEIVRRFGPDHWIMCCHADEFCYHDPRKVARRADLAGHDAIVWYSAHFMPHPSEWASWNTEPRRPVHQRLRHYHWGYAGSGLPWREDRMYLCHTDVYWDDSTHGCVRPHGVRQLAPFHPILKHYKVFTLDLDWYEPEGTSTFFRRHWSGNEHRTGVPLQVQTARDFFVESLPGYASCSRFEGAFDHAWNMGEEFRVDATSSSFDRECCGS